MRDALGREVLRLAVPAFGALVAPSLLLITDTAFVGTLGTNALAGLAAGTAVFGVAVGLSYFLAFTATGVVARRYGAGQYADAVAAGVNYIVLGLLIGTVAGVTMWWFAPVFIDWIGTTAASAPAAITWLRAAAWGTPALVASMAAIGLFRGLQDTRITFRVTSLQVGANIVLAAVLLFGFDLGIGAAGAAVAIAEVIGFGLFMQGLFGYARSVGATVRVSHARGLLAAFTHGLPLLWRAFALRTVLMGTTIVAARLSDSELAAFYVSLNIWYVLANLLDAIAIAAQAILGKRLGAAEGEDVHVIVGKLQRWAVRYGMGVGVLTIALAPVLPAAFSDDPAVQHNIMLAMLVIGVHQPLAGLVFLLDGVLIGSGDIRYIAFVQTAAMLVFLPIAYAVAHWQLGIIALWGAMIAFLITRAVLTYRRARTDAWIVEGATR